MNPSQPNAKVAPGPVLNSFTEQPVFWAAIAYGSGIVLTTFFWRPLLWFAVAGLAFIFFSVLFLRKRTALATILIIAAFMILGAMHLGLEQAASPPGEDIGRFADGSEVIVTGHVMRTSLPRKTQRNTFRTGETIQEEMQVVDIETESITSNEQTQAVQFGVRMTLRSEIEAADEDVVPIADPNVLAIAYGDRVRFPAKLREPRNYGNPGAMDYRGYLAGKDIQALASVSSLKVKKLDGFAGSRLQQWRYRIRNDVSRRMLDAVTAAPSPSISHFFSLDDSDTSLLLAMVIGEQSLLQHQTRVDFQRTGVFHILVVSGMNVGMLAVFIFWIARMFRASKVTATWTTIVTTLAYVFITDLGMPILRAALMLCIYLAARLLYRDRYSLNAVGTAALILLVLAPKSIFDPSFQLTFLSILALGGMVQPLLERSSLPYRRALQGLEFTGYDSSLTPRMAQFRIDLRMIVGRMAGLWSLNGLKILLPARISPDEWPLKVTAWLLTRTMLLGLGLFDLIAVSIIMQLALALPMAIYFHRLALVGVPANTVVIPLTGILMPAALVATLLSYISTTLATVPWAIAAACVHGIEYAVQYLGGSRFADLRVTMPTLMVAIFAAITFAFATLATNRGRRLATAGVIGIFVAAFILVMPSQPQFHPGVMEITAVDVGQGDAILLVSPEGKLLLIDGGGPAGPFRSDNFDIGEDVVSPYLWSRGIDRLDAVALTHAHSDHMSGLFSVINNFRPKELWIGVDSDSESFQGLIALAKKRGMTVMERRAGQEFEFGKVRMKVLSPPTGSIPNAKDRNKESLVLEAEFGGTSALLTGDAEKHTERLLAQSADPAALLKIAHHGSATSTTPELLERVHPQFAVISVGNRNLYGHPRADVLARLREAHVRTYRTDINGAVTFYLDGVSVRPVLPGH